MTKLGFVMGAATVCAAVVTLAGPPVSFQSANNQAAPPAIVAPADAKQVHRLVLQVNSDEPEVMTLALNNAANVESYYSGLGEKVEIEVVAFGPGLHMLRDDTSPVKARIKAMAGDFSASTRSRSFTGEVSSRSMCRPGPKATISISTFSFMTV